MGKDKKDKKRTARAPADEDNPEGLPAAPNNSLFGKPESGTAAAEVKAKKPKAEGSSKRKAEVLKEDPVAAALRAQKRAKKDADADGASGAKAPKSATPADNARTAKPHSAVVEQGNKLWEKLRSEKTGADERAKLVDELLTLFRGKLINLLQKHDAARVLQSCFKQGSAAQRDALMGQIRGELLAIARSHYGHFLLISIVRNGAPAHRQQLLAELKPHAAELLVHAEGSAVLQLLYSDVATNEQRTELYRALWGKEMTLFEVEGAVTSLHELFERDPIARPRVLRRLEILISKAARKGLAVTALVQRGAADLFVHGDAAQRAELVSSFREQAAHIMHTRDGAKIACACLRYGDAKDRKALLKALKGFAGRAATDCHGALVLCVAVEVVDDTVLLAKGVVAELCAELSTLALHAHGVLPLLQLLAPRSPRYFTPAQLSIMGREDGSASKKDPAVRRAELLATVLPALIKLGATQPVALACSPHGSALAFETVRVASEGAAPSDGSTGVAAPPADVAPIINAMAAAAPTGAGAGGSDDADAPTKPAPLVAHPIAARLCKRLAQRHEGFASALLGRLRGKLSNWAKQGAGWVVLALLENPCTRDDVQAELKGAAGALAKCSAVGCRSLSAALLGKQGPAAAAAAAAETEAGKAAGKVAKAKVAKAKVAKAKVVKSSQR